MSVVYEYSLFEVNQAAQADPNQLIKQMNDLGSQGWMFLSILDVPQAIALQPGGRNLVRKLMMMRQKPSILMGGE